jgi:HK97 family phage prohead protease
MKTTTYSAAIEKFSSDLAAQRQVRFIASDATPDRQGDILEPQGCDLSNFRKSPTLLWMHNPNAPVARAIEISATSRAVTCLAQFPDAGIDEQSDKVYGLIQSGVVNSVSVGFMPIKSTPLPKGGSKYTRWELLEVSFVSIPANPSAIITQRAMPSSRSDEHDEIRERAKALLREVREDMRQPDPDEDARASARATLAALREAGVEW